MLMGLECAAGRGKDGSPADEQGGTKRAVETDLCGQEDGGSWKKVVPLLLAIIATLDDGLREVEAIAQGGDASNSRKRGGKTSGGRFLEAVADYLELRRAERHLLVVEVVHHILSLHLGEGLTAECIPLALSEPTSCP
jgi:hypothetical protein